MNDQPDAAPVVLVFDDDLIANPSFLGDFAARFVYRANADAAITDVLAVAPDLVFMDYSMGSTIDGATAVRTLRARFPDLPIIAISSDSRCNRSMLEAGATDGTPKMALPEQLRAVLTYARPFDGHAQSPPPDQAP